MRLSNTHCNDTFGVVVNNYNSACIGMNCISYFLFKFACSSFIYFLKRSNCIIYQTKTSFEPIIHLSTITIYHMTPIIIQGHSRYLKINPEHDSNVLIIISNKVFFSASIDNFRIRAWVLFVGSIFGTSDYFNLSLDFVELWVTSI